MYSKLQIISCLPEGRPFDFDGGGEGEGVKDFISAKFFPTDEQGQKIGTRNKAYQA